MVAPAEPLPQKTPRHFLQTTSIHAMMSSPAVKRTIIIPRAHVAILQNGNVRNNDIIENGKSLNWLSEAIAAAKKKLQNLQHGGRNIVTQWTSIEAKLNLGQQRVATQLLRCLLFKRTWHHPPFRRLLFSVCFIKCTGPSVWHWNKTLGIQSRADKDNKVK